MRSKFLFSIVDDTDDSTLENTRPIYDFLYENGIYITKTVWVYPPRDNHSSGDSLQRPEYLEFIREIRDKGFEIGMHGVGSGVFKREEILEGLEEFREKLGEYPRIHVNHSYNPDSIYGGYKRFNWPFSWIVRSIYKQYAGVFQGEIEGSENFWGDKHKELIRFSRNHEFAGLNTSRYDKYMPYRDPRRTEYANYWYSATFAPNQWVFNHVLTPQAVKKLEQQRGACILFTHLGYYMKDGRIDPGFRERIKLLAGNPSGHYLPVSGLLDILAEERREKGQEPYPLLPLYAKFLMEIRHLFTRVKYRRFLKLDDYAFKELNKNMFVE